MGPATAPSAVNLPHCKTNPWVHDLDMKAVYSVADLQNVAAINSSERLPGVI
jgi:hypothetical protein